MRYILNILNILNILIILLLCSPCYAGTDFDGVDDRVIISYQSGFDLQGDFTLCFQGVLDDYGGALNYEMKMLEKDADGSGDWRFSIRGTAEAANTGKITFSPDVVGDSRVFSTGTFGLGALHTACLTFDNTTPVYVFYIDAVAAGTAGTDITPITTSSDDLCIGQCESSSDNTYVDPWDGEVYEATIWTATLTAEEIALWHNAKVKSMALQIQPASLVSNWWLDNVPDGVSVDGQIILDYSGNNYHGTGDDGDNNSGLTSSAEIFSTYP